MDRPTNRTLAGLRRILTHPDTIVTLIESTYLGEKCGHRHPLNAPLTPSRVQSMKNGCSFVNTQPLVFGDAKQWTYAMDPEIGGAVYAMKTTGRGYVSVYRIEHRGDDYEPGALPEHTDYVTERAINTP